MKPLTALVMVLVTTGVASCAHATADVHVQHARLPRAVAGPQRQVSHPSPDPLSMEMSAYLAPEPAQLDVRLRVEPDARSRAVTIEWWTTDGVGGSHLISLDGDRAPVRHNYPLTRMTEGVYAVTAVLRRSDGTEVRARRRVIVVGERAARQGASGTPGIAEAEFAPLAP